MAKKLTQKQLSELRAEYILKREELLSQKVDRLSVKLFDGIFDGYLVALEQSDGKLVQNDLNYNLVKGLDDIYKSFRQNHNIPVVKGFISDLQAITPINEKYFANIAKKNIRSSSEKIQLAIDKKLGIEPNGQPKPNGFADKFIRDESVLKAIRKLTNQALTKGTGFQEFRQQMKTLIEGDPKAKQSGKLQQYYRTYAYDTYAKVDRLNGDMFAKDLGLRYFIWSGGIINTTRPLCKYCNDKIVDSLEFKNLSYETIKDKYKPGLDENWVPLDDLGQHNCRHLKDYIADEVALRNLSRWLDVSSLM